LLALDAMQKIAFWYWREFLKRSDAYAQCCAEDGRGPLARMFEHFGNVFSLGFDEWWESGKSKFQVEQEFLVNFVRTRAEFAQAFDDDADDLLGVVINLNAPIRRVLREVERVLRSHSASDGVNDGRPMRKRGRPTTDTSLYHTFGPSRTLTAQDTEAMDIMLKVFDLCSAEDKKPRPQRLRRHQIGRLLNIDVAEPSGDLLDSGHENMVITVKVCNYYRKAKVLIANAEVGVFPSYL
jgi:hypothetical protein